MNLLDKIAEIKQLAIDGKGYKKEVEKRMKLNFENIIAICNHIEIDFQIEKRLKDEQSD